ncbi:response regulator receiver domain-containing protein [Pseudoduganella lurida]|uniref:histidine kinase n=1 Tax=Pseudoduganella lurida TaxID=1036180 RepID=A0A562RF78_9BURK|nr:CHASE domain-containing protein [Pseudoduganella lurida]TWI67715.1 response regulator receiver domain-containing protein [Pseudoduganella lurida]
MRPSSPPPAPRPSGRLLPLALALGTLCVGLATTGLAWHSLRLAHDQQLRAEFDYRVRDLALRIGPRMATYEQVLRGAQAYVAAADSLPQPGAFRTYVATLQLRQYYPGIQGIGIALLQPSVTDPARQKSAVAMIEPLDLMNRRALGFDMFGEPVRHAAMARARDTGAAALTGQVRLVQEGPGGAGQPGFLMYLPLYRGAPADEAGRRAALYGWVYGAFRMHDFMAGLNGEREADLHVALYDGTRAAAACMLGCTPPPGSRLQATQTLSIAGRTWILQAHGTPVFEQRLASRQAAWAGVVGIVISLLSATLVWLLAHGRARARQLVRRVTAALQRSNSTLRSSAAREAERQRDLRDAQQALHRAQKLEAVGKLTGGVAHDFNNVLQVIYGNVQAVATNPRSPDTPRRLDGALAAVERGARLSGQLLAFARRQPLDPVVINMARVLRDIDDLLRRALGDAITLSTRVEPGLWNTLVDPNQLENVILNLAINARDAMRSRSGGPSNGQLTIELLNCALDEDYTTAVPEAVAGDYVLLAVSDNGSGMAPDVIERVFEPFFTTKPEGEGTGLGLSMAYGFVRQTGGHIRVYSEVGVGTTLRLYFPRSSAPEVAQAATSVQAVVGGDECILLAEDDDAVRDTVAAMLRSLHYRVIETAGAEEALQVLRSGAAVDLLFTDVIMPGAVRATELADFARQLRPGIAVLFTSGYTQEAVTQGGQLEAGVHLLSKPYRRDELARKVRAVLDEHDAHDRRTADAVPICVLVVEDNEDLRELTCEMIATLGYRAQGVGSAEAALEALDSSAYDAVFTDVELPGISGLELAQRLAADGECDAAIVVVTGRALGEPLPPGVRLLLKPYRIDAVEEILMQIRMERQPAPDPAED